MNKINSYQALWTRIRWMLRRENLTSQEILDRLQGKIGNRIHVSQYTIASKIRWMSGMGVVDYVNVESISGYPMKLAVYGKTGGK